MKTNLTPAQELEHFFTLMQESNYRVRRIQLDAFAEIVNCEQVRIRCLQEGRRARRHEIWGSVVSVLPKESSSVTAITALHAQRR